MTNDSFSYLFCKKTWRKTCLCARKKKDLLSLHEIKFLNKNIYETKKISKQKLSVYLNFI